MTSVQSSTAGSIKTLKEWLDDRLPKEMQKINVPPPLVPYSPPPILSSADVLSGVHPLILQRSLTRTHLRARSFTLARAAQPL